MTERSVSDAALLRDIFRELQTDPRIGEAEIGIEALGGRVHLTGFVTTFLQKIAIRDAVLRLPGAQAMTDEIRVLVAAFPQKTDSELNLAVRAALAWDVFLPQERISSRVQDGWVILEGSVDSPEDRADAEGIVRALAGVQGVINDLESAGGEAKEIGRLRQAIEETLRRHAESEADEIAVGVVDGEILVSGIVHCRREREEILSAIRTRTGRSVTADSLRVAPPGSPVG